MKHCTRAAKLAEEVGDKLPLAEIYNSLGLIYNHEGNYGKALKYHFNALKLYGETGIDEAIPDVYNNIGLIYLKQKKCANASRYFSKALLFAKQIGSVELIKRSYQNWATLDSTQGNYKKALDHYKLAIIYRDSLFNEENTKKLVQSQMQYEFDKKQDSLKAAHDKKDALSAGELKNQKLIRNFSLAGVAALVSFGSFSFYRYKRKKKLQNQQSLLNERLRISRELHDEVGATLSSISIFSQAAIQKNESGNIADSKNILERIGETAGK